ncbi:hypothetical protein [Thalassospira marina]|nr:hypothetical protein [Thalassospira marina]
MIPLLVAASGLPVRASEQSDIRNEALELRMNIARFEKDLQHSLRDAIQTAPDRVIQCKTHPATLKECLSGPYRSLTRATVTIKPSPAIGTDSPNRPLLDLGAAEERFALYNERVNKTNDLLSRAGLPLFVPERDLTPDMDELRKHILVYMENRQASSLRFEKITLFAGGLAVLCAIFGGLYLYLRRFRG